MLLADGAKVVSSQALEDRGQEGACAFLSRFEMTSAEFDDGASSMKTTSSATS